MNIWRRSIRKRSINLRGPNAGKHSPHMATEAGSTAAMSAILRIDLEVRSDWWILQSPEPTSSSRLAPGDFLLSEKEKIFKTT